MLQPATKPTPTEIIEALDAQIDANRDAVIARLAAEPANAAEWQAAWDAHPDLCARDHDLYRQRGVAQRERGDLAFEDEKRQARVTKREQRAKFAAAEAERRDRAATQLSIATLRAKADRAASIIDAMRMRASADRLEADLIEDASATLRADLDALIADTLAAPAMVPMPVQPWQADAGGRTRRIRWNATADDKAIISQIVSRAKTAGLIFEGYDAQTCRMDLIATHLNGNPLRLADLLAADDFNFSHDICGIAACIDRETAKLTRNFSPRFSVRSQKAAA